MTEEDHDRLTRLQRKIMPETFVQQKVAKKVENFLHEDLYNFALDKPKTMPKNNTIVKRCQDATTEGTKSTQGLSIKRPSQDTPHIMSRERFDPDCY